MPRVVRASSGTPELGLEPRQPPADHRLRHAEPRPRPAQAAAVDHLGEGADVVEVGHGRRSESCKSLARIMRLASRFWQLHIRRVTTRTRTGSTPMNTILVIDSAVSGEASVSKALVREAVAALTADAPRRRRLPRPRPRPGPAPDRGDARRRPRRAADRGRARRPRPLRRADRRAPRRRHHRDRRADVQLQRPDRPARLVRLRAARRRDLQLLRGRARRACSPASG